MLHIKKESIFSVLKSSIFFGFLNETTIRAKEPEPVKTGPIVTTDSLLLYRLKIFVNINEYTQKKVK